LVLALDLAVDEKSVDLDQTHSLAGQSLVIAVEPMASLVPAFGSTKAKTRSKSRTLI